MKTSDAGRARRSSLLAMAVALAIACGLDSACAAERSGPPPERGTPVPGGACEVQPFLVQNAPRYLASVEAAHAWLDALEFDPTHLRAQGLKGKKKLTEQIDAYHRLWQIADPAGRAALRPRLERIAAVTRKPAFHDMASVDEKQFKQDATSYLRAALLLEGMGLDTSLYRREILAIKPRLDAHMYTRGPFQRATFAWYYEHFGLEAPASLDGALAQGLIAGRASPAAMTDLDVYQLTHEVFVPFEYGDRLDVRPFTDEDLAYLEPALGLLADRYMHAGDADLLAELVSCQRYLGLEGTPSYARGLAFLLQAQNPDGSWGDLAAIEWRYGPLGRYRITLHTTLVALEALTVAFHEPWNRARWEGCEASQAEPDRSRKASGS